MKILKIICVILAITLLISIFVINRTENNISKNDNQQEFVPIETKIGQMIVIGYSNDENIREKIYEQVKRNNLSGIIFYKSQIFSKDDIQSKINILNNIPSAYPLFIMVDQEGGKVSRIANDNGFTTYPSAEEIGKKYSANDAYNIYYKMAKDLNSVGFNFNLAPCVDIKINKKSFISKKNRCYGSDYNIVYKFANEFINAHNKANVITALKHFPGMGNASSDSHKTLPDTTETWSDIELIPFEKIINEKQFQPVMVGHTFNKKIDDKNISSLSEKTINILKKYNHNGVIITDAIDMSAVEDMNTEELIITAINSGIDLFIFPNHQYLENNPKLYMEPEFFISTVKNAINDGKIKEKRINDAYKKIICLKNEYIKRNESE